MPSSRERRNWPGVSLAEAAAAVEARIDLAAFVAYLDESYRSSEDDLSETRSRRAGVPGSRCSPCTPRKDWSGRSSSSPGSRRGGSRSRCASTARSILMSCAAGEQHRDSHTPEPEAAREVNYRAEERRLCYVAMTRRPAGTAPDTRAGVLTTDSPEPGHSSTKYGVRDGGATELPPVVQPRTEREAARSLHEAMTAALEVPVRQSGAATAIAHALTAQWAAETLDGALPLRHRTSSPRPQRKQPTAPRSELLASRSTYQTCPAPSISLPVCPGTEARAGIVRTGRMARRCMGD